MEQNFYQAPSRDQQLRYSQDLVAWKQETHALIREWSFPNFARAMVFVNRVVNPCEEWQHYPKITISYNRVSVEIRNHSAGQLCLIDFELALAIQRLDSQSRSS